MSKPTKTQKREAKPPAPRRRLNPAVRRAELIEAALRVLRSRGPTEVRVEDVTQAAGAAKGTFYLYFASWNDLLIAVRPTTSFSIYTSEVRTRFATATLSDRRPGRIESECIRFVNFVGIEFGDLGKAIFHGPIADQPMNAAHSADTFVAELLGAEIESGACRPVEVDPAAPLLFSVLHTTTDEIARSGNRERMLESMLGLLRAWLRTPMDESNRGVRVDSKL